MTGAALQPGACRINPWALRLGHGTVLHLREGGAFTAQQQRQPPAGALEAVRRIKVCSYRPMTPPAACGMARLLPDMSCSTYIFAVGSKPFSLATYRAPHPTSCQG